MAKKENQAIDIVPEFCPNKNGVPIKKCCASCKHHQPLDDKAHRLCAYGVGLSADEGEKKVVFKFEVCQHWEISDAINDIRTNGHGV